MGRLLLGAVLQWLLRGTDFDSRIVYGGRWDEAALLGGCSHAKPLSNSELEGNCWPHPQAGYPCLSLHGGKDQSDRESTIADYKSGVGTILVATSGERCWQGHEQLSCAAHTAGDWAGLCRPALAAARSTRGITFCLPDAAAALVPYRSDEGCDPAPSDQPT
jgi:hypothetical protein